MPTPEALRRYLGIALAGTSEVLDALVGALPDDDGFWDFRPDPERFTPREVLAHLADWNPIWLGRVERFVKEDHPNLPDLDEGRLSVERAYSQQEPSINLKRFRSTREALSAAVAGLSVTDWERAAHRDKIGDHTLVQMITLVVAHDGYHTKQLAEYLDTWRKA
jgi:uncharacterized damage-inducible protein DinB